MELYLDGRGNRAPRMDADDFQFVASCDGRTAVLQGDPVLTRLKTLAVPKVVRRLAAVRAAAARTPAGYTVELAVPLPAVLASARAPVALALDLCVNDWDRTAPPLEPVDVDDLVEAARRELRGEAGAAASGPDPWERAVAAGYRPYSLASGADFGYPWRWVRAELVGEPAWPERWIERIGPGDALAVAVAITAAAWLAVLAVVERVHRRRVRALLERLAAPTGAAPTDEADREPLEAVWRGAPPAGCSELTERAVALVRERLAEALRPGDVARALHVSLRTLQRGLAADLGCTPRELIVGVKLHAARKLLESGRLRVNEAASRVGFDDPAHFSRRYRAYFGEPPSAALPRR